MIRFVGTAILVSGLCTPTFAVDPIVPDGRAGFEAVVKPFLQKHCNDCHSDDNAEGELDLTTISPEVKSAKQVDDWLKALEQLQADLMPPLDEERPDSAERARAILLDRERRLLDQVAPKPTDEK